MKVLMLGRIGLFRNGGGDRVQIENTAAELRKMGIEVDTKSGFDIDLNGYDLVHVFQLDWTPETYFYVRDIKEAGKPLVLSPIHHNVDEVKRFDDMYAFDFRRISRLLFKEQHKRDTFKNLYRCIFTPAKIEPTLKSVILGLKNMHSETLEMADIVLVQTELEAADLQKTYNANFNWIKITNGVGEQFLNPSKGDNPLDQENYILSVGRIEPRKDQLSLIKAVDLLRKKTGKDIRLVLIGKKPKNRHFEYICRFNRLLKKHAWVKHISKVPYDKMPRYYSHAKVGASVSWFESTGLTNLEALFCGANIVATGDRATEYLGDMAFYAEPGNIESISLALEKAYSAEPPQIPEKMYKDYTWTNTAERTLKLYRNILK